MAVQAKIFAGLVGLLVHLSTVFDFMSAKNYSLFRILADAGVYEAWVKGNKSFNPPVRLTIAALLDLEHWRTWLPRLKKKIHQVRLPDGSLRSFIFNKNVINNLPLVDALKADCNRHLFKVIESD